MVISSTGTAKPMPALKKTGFWTPGRKVLYSTIMVLLILFLFPLRWLFFVDAYAEIQMGMSHEELIAVVGCSPGDYRGDVNSQYVQDDMETVSKPPAKALLWQFYNHAIVVLVDDKGVVAGKMHYRAESQTSLREAIGHRLGIYWLFGGRFERVSDG